MEKNVQVTVRCRPLSESEKKSAKASVVQCKPIANEICVRRKTYTFDKVFGQYATQQEVFECSVQGIIDEAINGYNCTVFAYGQTGTGKTHTIQGDLKEGSEGAGIVPRAINYIFQNLRAYQEYSVKVSFLQLYNEDLQDLLDLTGEKKLRLMEDTKRGEIYCQHLQEVSVHNPSDVFGLLKTAAMNRTTAETLLNASSSRSHCIFTVKIHVKETTPEGEDLVKIGKLHLVDLAGSECIGRSGAKSSRAREAGNINQSLLTLGRVITALVDKHPHIPYRDSKLTRLLQESLGGKAKTLIIATLAPCGEFVEETMSTLDYAHRAKSIKNKPEINQRMTKRTLIKEYSVEVESLRTALQAARDKNGIYLDPVQYRNMEDRLSGQESQIGELEGIIEKKNQETKDYEIQVKTIMSEYSQLQEHVSTLQKELQDKDILLEATNEKLQITETNLTATKHIVESYQLNEKDMLSKAEKAKEILEECRKENNLLRDKVVRKNNIEDANSVLLTELNEKTSDSFTKIKLDIKEFQEAYSLQNNKMEKILIDSIQEKEMYEQEITQAIAKVKQSIEQKVSDLTKETNLLKEDVGEHFNSVKEVNKSSKESLSKKVEDFSNILTCQNQVLQLLAQQKEQLEKSAKVMSLEYDQGKKETNEFANQLILKASAIEDYVRNIIEEKKVILVQECQEIEEIMNKRINACKEEANEMNQLWQKALQSFVNKQETSLKSCIQKVLNSTNSVSKEISNVVNGVQEQTLIVQEDSKQFQQSVLTRFTQLEESFSTHLNNVEAMNKSVVQLSEETSSTTQLTQKGINSQIDENSNALLMHLDKGSKEFNFTLEKHSSDIQKTNDLSSELLNAIGVNVHLSFKNLQKTNHNIQTKTKDISEDTKGFTEKQLLNINKTQESVTDYVNNVKSDIVTGTTPMKVKDISFPVFKSTQINDENETKKRRREYIKTEMAASLIPTRCKKVKEETMIKEKQKENVIANIL